MNEPWLDQALMESGFKCESVKDALNKMKAKKSDAVFDFNEWLLNKCIYLKNSTHVYLIKSISQYLHVKTMLASRCVSFYETKEASSRLCIRFLSNLCKNDLNTVLGRNLFSIANDCFVNLFDLSQMLYWETIEIFDV